MELVGRGGRAPDHSEGYADFRLKVSRGIREDIVFVPLHWGGRRAAKRLTNPALDPTSRMPDFKVCAVRNESLVAADAAEKPTGGNSSTTTER